MLCLAPVQAWRWWCVCMCACRGEDVLELQVPPDCGNGKENCGVPLARLLWHVPVSAMVTLIASMLLERRIIIVGQSHDTVTAAVQAASAMLYPFKCVRAGAAWALFSWVLGLGLGLGLWAGR